MQYKKFGRTGLQVSRICLGTGSFGAQVNEADSIQVINSAIDTGINFIDTADAYVRGRTEEIVGKALKGKRDSVVLASKVGFPTGKGVTGMGLSRKHIMQAVEASLRRLNTDYLDIYYGHKPDYNTPIEETLKAMDDLVRQGKVRYIAYSNCRAWQLCKALAISDHLNIARFECVQTPYNLVTRENEYELLSFCASENIGITVYHPLAGGLLTGKYDFNKPPAEGTKYADKEDGELYRQRYWRQDNFEAVDHIKKIVQKGTHSSMAQFALAWVLSNETITSAVCGASSTRQLDENLKALEMKLSREELAACDEVWQEIHPTRFLYGR